MQTRSTLLSQRADSPSNLGGRVSQRGFRQRGSASVPHNLDTLGALSPCKRGEPGDLCSEKLQWQGNKLHGEDWFKNTKDSRKSNVHSRTGEFCVSGTAPPFLLFLRPATKKTAGLPSLKELRGREWKLASNPKGGTVCTGPSQKPVQRYAEKTVGSAGRARDGDTELIWVEKAPRVEARV